MLSLSWLILLFPFLGFVVMGLLNKRLSVTLSGTIASAMIFLSFIITCLLFYYVKQDADVFSPEGVILTKFSWINVGDIAVDSANIIGDEVGQLAENISELSKALASLAKHLADLAGDLIRIVAAFLPLARRLARW